MPHNRRIIVSGSLSNNVTVSETVVQVNEFLNTEPQMVLSASLLVIYKNILFTSQSTVVSHKILGFGAFIQVNSLL